MEDNDMGSFIFKSVDTKQKQDQDALSAEDLAWADSCLIQDPEMSETNMDSLKEALLQILDQHSEIHGLSTDQTAPENSHSAMEEEVTSHAAGKSVDQDLEQESYDVLSILKKQPFLPNYHDEMMNFQFQHSEIDGLSNDQTAPENSHSVIEEEVTSHAAGKSVDQDSEQESYDVLSILKKQPFLPNYHDEMMNFQFPDDDMGFLVSEFVEPLSDEDIFKVWDLDIPVEDDEDELDIDKQLKKALSSDADDTVDSLVESIADLSIK